MKKSSRRIETRPLTPEYWTDLEALFGERGAIFEPIRPSQHSTALSGSFSKLSSTRSRMGSEATRMNSRMSSLPSKRSFRPICANASMSGNVPGAALGMVFSQNGLSASANRCNWALN